MISEKIKLTGALSIILTDCDGNTVDSRYVDNLVVQVGKNWVAGAMIATPAFMNAMAVGTSGTTPASTDTILGAEVGRVAISTPTVSGAVVTYVATFPAGTGSGSLQEAGIFNSTTANAGVMLTHTTFPVINKTSTLAMSITWNVTIN
jgi:hypothetical protein